MTTTPPRPIRFAPSSARSTRTRSTSSSPATSAKSCWRWSPGPSRLKTPFITPGAASNEISKSVHADYEKNKYTFHGYLTSAALALSVCDAAKELLVEQKHMKTAVIMSEDAAWTKPLDVGYEECLPKIGLKVLDHIRFSPDTTDFTPIFNKIEGAKPDVIITGISHVGVQPTVQWKNQQVPIPMFGISSQATNETFGKDTNDASDGVLYQGVSRPGRAGDAEERSRSPTPSRRSSATSRPMPATPPMTKSISSPMPIKRAGSTDADKMVEAMEKTDWVGTIGRVQFYGKDGYLTSAALALSVCDAAKDLLVDEHAHEDRRHHERGRRLDQAARRRLRGMPAEDRPEGARPHPLLARHHRLHADLQQDRGRRSRT